MLTQWAVLKLMLKSWFFFLPVLTKTANKVFKNKSYNNQKVYNSGMLHLEDIVDIINDYREMELETLTFVRL